MLPKLTEVRAEQAFRTLAHFVRYSWEVLEPATPLIWNWHMDALCEHVQATLMDWLAVQRAAMQSLPIPPQRIRNLLVNIPPGTAKSRIVSVGAPSWFWLHCPSWRAIFLSANPRVSLRDSMYCRQVIESEWYQEWFEPSWKLAPDQNAKGLYRNTESGFRMAIGIGSRITGDRADALFVDDPNDVGTADSEVIVKGVNTYWDQSAANRVNDLQTSVRIGIQQRVREKDWSGHILPSGVWEHLVLPMEYDPERARTTAIGWRDPRTQEGELLFPARFPESILQQERTRLGSMGYAGQHQQRPAPAEGAIFKKHWFENRYRTLPALRDVATFWDTALKAKEVNDETASLTVGTGPDGNPYLLRMQHGHWETPDVAHRLTEQADWLKGLFGDEYRGDYVEDKVSGTTLMQYVRRSRPDLALIPVQVEGDKVARAHGVTPLCESQRVIFPDVTAFPATEAWVRDLLDQLLLFPGGAHDDIVDVFVYALKRFLGTLNKRKSRRGKSGGYV